MCLPALGLRSGQALAQVRSVAEAEGCQAATDDVPASPWAPQRFVMQQQMSCLPALKLHTAQLAAWVERASEGA